MSDALITAAIILGLLFLFIVLFIFLHRKGHNQRLALQKVVLADIIWKNKLQITAEETINNNFIAIDKVNFVLLYINFSNEKEEVILTDLWQIKAVKVTTEENSIFEQRKGKSVLIDKQVCKLQLEIILVDALANAHLLFYEYKDGMQNFVEIKRRADYWCDVINNAVLELPHLSRQNFRYP